MRRWQTMWMVSKLPRLHFGEGRTDLHRHKLVIDTADVCETGPVTQNGAHGRLESFGDLALGVCKLPELGRRAHEPAHAGPVIGERTEQYTG